MTERKPFEFKKIKTEEVVQYIPPAWCGAICRNAMNEICVESCAIKRDTSAFELKPNLTLQDMPRFPKTERMTKEEKFTSVTVYLAKVVDHLQGNEAEALAIPPKPSKVKINAAIAEVSSSLRDSQNEADLAKANGNNSNQTYSSRSIVNKEQE